MAKKTFLQHIVALNRELGVIDSEPTTVESVTDKDLLRLIQQWNEAYKEIYGLHSDWKFAWSSWSTTTVVGTSDYAAPADSLKWCECTVKYNGNRIDVIEYEDIMDTVEYETTNGTPYRAIILPNNNLRFDPPPDAAVTIEGDYYKRCTALSLDGDTSDIPEQYEDIVIWRAMVMWGDFDESDPIRRAGIERFSVMIQQLEGNQLFNNFGARTRAYARDTLDVKVE